MFSQSVHIEVAIKKSPMDDFSGLRISILPDEHPIKLSTWRKEKSNEASHNLREEPINVPTIPQTNSRKDLEKRTAHVVRQTRVVAAECCCPICQRSTLLMAHGKKHGI